MRSPKFWILVTVVLAMGALAVFIVRELDVERQERRITDLATAFTGRQVEIRGGIRIGFSLRPTLVAEDVRIANAAWGSRPTMLTAERIDVSLALLPLFSGSVEISEVKFSGVDLFLETDSGGRRNWDLGTDKDDGGTGGSEVDVSVQTVAIENLSLEIRGPGSGGGSPIEVARLTVRTDDATQLLNLDLSANLAGAEFVAVGTVGSLEDWLSARKVPLSLGLRWGISELKAETTLELGGRPRLHGRVLSGTIDIEEWLSDGSEDSEDPSDQGRLFSSTPLGLAAVGSSNADVSLAVSNVVGTRARLDLQHADISSNRGILQLNSVKGVVSGAEIEGSLEIDGRAATPRVRLTLLAHNLDLGALLRRLALTDAVDAVIDVRVNVHGSGDSVAALFGSLDGDVALAASRGEIPTSFVSRLVSNLPRLIMPWAHPPNRVEIECAVAEFTVAQGVARTQTLMFNTSQLTLSGQGQIDLGRETLDVLLAPRPRDSKLLTLATDITLSGPISNPRASPTPIGLVTSAARLALGPVRLFSPLPGTDSTRRRECVDRVRKVAADASGSK